MNIALFSQTFPLTPTDSTAHFMYDFARGFAENGHTAYALVPFHPRLRPRAFGSIRVIPFRYIIPGCLHLLGYGRTLRNDQKIPWFVYLLTPFYLLFGTLALWKLVRRQHIDIINAHWIVPNGFCAAIVSHMSGIPLVITIPGTDAYLAKTNPLARLMTQVAVAGAAHIVSNSPQLLRDLRVRGRVISYGVPHNTGARTKHAGVVLATAGRPVEKKGFDLLQKTYPDIEIISGLPIDQFRKKLLGVDICIALSIRDAKGNLDDASLTVLEAMAAGCSVITSNFPGYRRIITNGKNGFLIDPTDQQALDAIVKKLTQSRTLRKQIGAAARRTIRTHVLPKHTAACLCTLFGHHNVTEGKFAPHCASSK